MPARYEHPISRPQAHRHGPLELHEGAFGDIRAPGVVRIGIGGPVGSGKTALIEALVPILMASGHRPLVVTNDIFTEEDAKHVRATLSGVLNPERIVGVETGSCPHAAVRDDPSMNLDAVAQLMHRFPDGDVVLVESGGDNLTLTFSRVLADYFIFVIDVAEGDKIPRKRGPGVTNSDLLVINKTDLAPHVQANLGVMDRDARAVRGDRPFVFTNCFTGDGLGEVANGIEQVINRLHPSPSGSPT